MIAEIERISQMRKQNIITKSQAIEKLKECDLKNNIFCTITLGSFYFNTKDYALAYPYLMKSSGIHTVNNKSAASSDKFLGTMYLYGLGVLADTNKAMKHFKICAAAGNSYCAYHIAIIYSSKYSQINNLNDKRNFAKYVYAWMKVTQTLQSLDKDRQLDKASYFKKYHPLQITDHYKEEHNSKEISSADELARKICSSISKCRQ